LLGAGWVVVVVTEWERVATCTTLVFVVDYNLKINHPSDDYMTAAQGHTLVPHITTKQI
jgi:hypothetical protein